jgi:3-phenylpropionate/cinnamic acid dioxygenase small subunit
MPLASAELYTEIQSFYARHMQLIDSGEVEAWVHGFAPDATISNNTKPQPAHGREAILTVIRRAQEELQEQGVQHRHWVGMLVVERVDDRTVHADSYALIIATERGGSPVVDRSTRCHDELVWTGDDWQIQLRRVHHDGHA